MGEIISFINILSVILCKHGNFRGSHKVSKICAFRLFRQKVTQKITTLLNKESINLQLNIQISTAK